MRSLGDTRAATGVGPPSRVGSSSKEPTPVGFYTSGWTPPPAKTGLAVWLEPGEQRIIYLTPDESEPLNFDFYPSDFACSARGPGGQVAVRPDYHHRSLDLWHDYWSVGSVVADVAGLYRISCSVHDDPLLVLAAPARFTVGWAEPVGLVGVGILLGSALIHTALAIVR